MLIESDVELASKTTLRVGGRARWFARARSEAEIPRALEFASEHGARVFILGGGSNVVVPDQGVDGLVLSIDVCGVELEPLANGVRLSAGAGEIWDEVVRESVERGWSGLECMSGIPGLVGATPIQNVGAYGQEVADTIGCVRVFDRTERRFVSIDAGACSFSYRDSRFKSAEPERFVVSAVTFELGRKAPNVRYPELARALASLGSAPTVADVRREVLALRRSKSMLLDPKDENARSCGSFFVNPIVTSEQARDVELRFGDASMPRYRQADGREKLSAAWLIEHSGFAKGVRSGNVGISSRHALALVCHEGATASELLAFAREIQARVRDRAGVELTPEPVRW